MSARRSCITFKQNFGFFYVVCTRYLEGCLSFECACICAFVCMAIGVLLEHNIKGTREYRQEDRI